MAGGVRPVEQMVDSGIERVDRERVDRERAARERVARERQQPIELARRSAGESSLARRDGAQPRVPTRLRWKGLDVSEEFREYAERVARGEQLPPFEGRVLAEPNPAFPWGGESTLGEELPKKRSSHPALWGAAIVTLGLLGWSLVLKLQSAPLDSRALEGSALQAGAQSAALETAIAPLAPPESAPSTTNDVAANEGTPRVARQDVARQDVAPQDVVTTAVGSAQALTESLEPAPVAAPALPLESEPQATVVAAPAVAAPPVGAPQPASVAVDLARPGALQQAVGAALAARGGAASPAPSKPAPSAPREDEFGIMASVSPAPVGAAPASPAPAPTGAKSSSNVGDLSRAGQAPGAGVRKEPGSESSAKGSLLVETPSF